LLESPTGDYLLSPAYDLVNTRMHVNDSEFALDRGLFADKFQSEQSKWTGHPTKYDFIEFAKRIGIRNSRINKLLAPFLEKQPLMENLVAHSFLSASNKRGYLYMYNTRRKLLNTTSKKQNY